MTDYLYIAPGLDAWAVFSSDVLEATTERHKTILHIGALTNGAGPHRALEANSQVAGVVVGLNKGVAGREQLRLASRMLRRHLRVWFYWPGEQVVECIDRERLRSLWRHWTAVLAFDKVGRRVNRLVAVYRDAFPVHRDIVIDKLSRMRLNARPVPFARQLPPDRAHKIVAGLYLRTDFWTSNISGGSYGHTCYVAKELAALTERFACLLTQRFALLDTLGVHQVTMDAPPEAEGEDAIITAPSHYYPIVKAACQLLRPSFIYERLCLGNCVAASLSHELQIPYVVEYNGSEISMQRSFDTGSLLYEDVYLRVEEVAFRQATLISVISSAVRDDLVARGVDARKILVNPNGADLDNYAPAQPDEKRRIRAELGFSEDDRVVGFTGTFGGWHGIDVLSAAVPKICAAAPHVQFLVIGDGAHKPAFDAEVDKHHLNDRVRRVGRVPQQEGARLLKACDIYVSPHNAHMIDSKFFGSPTKVFEYMAMGGGIVASDLEQIGEVLAPALRPGELDRPSEAVTTERAVLCAPGDVEEFVAGVVGLAGRPDLCAALGANARQAVADHYSWRQHVARLWTFAAELPRGSDARPLTTGDAYKDQVQNQWNNTPVGSETASDAQPHTLDWFVEVERYRYEVYAHWMPSVMEFDRHPEEDVLEIGGGMGTDLAQFARNGARVTDLDLSAGHLQLAQENFRLRGLTGRFVHHDAESLPFDDASFDLVYANGVLHHTPNTARAIAEIRRVLRPGGRVFAMFYAENSLHYWRNLVWHFGVSKGELSRLSMGDIMSRRVERTGNEARPLVKVYTKPRLRRAFKDFCRIAVLQRQMTPEILPRWLVPALPVLERLSGWNLIVKATRPT